MEEYKLITDTNEIKKLLNDYFWELNVRGKFKEALTYFSKKEGYDIGEKMISFENDLDYCDKAYTKLQGKKLFYFLSLH